MKMFVKRVNIDNTIGYCAIVGLYGRTNFESSNE